MHMTLRLQSSLAGNETLREAMELAMPPQFLVTVLLAVVVVFLVAFLQVGRTRSRRPMTARATTTQAAAMVAATPNAVVDLDDARRMLVDHAEYFSNRPVVPLPVDLDAGHATRTYSITSAPYGPLWRVLRGNLTANVLHPSRLASSLVPLQRDAVVALVADLLSVSSGGETDVVVRDRLYAAVFTTMARACFGDGSTGERDVRAMRRALHDFLHLDADLALLARSRLARLLHWRQWWYLVGTRARLLRVFGPVVEARRQYRLSGAGAGGIYSYVDSLLDLRIPCGGDGTAAEAEPPAAAGGKCRRRALRLDEIVRLVWEFLAASTDTVTSCVEWTLAHLATQPEIQEKLYRELLTVGGQHVVAGDERLPDTPYLRAVILESLRLHPPAPVLVRDVGPEGAAVARITTPPQANGGTLTTTRFMFMADKVGRDPKAWTEPDEFKPERFLAGGEGEDVRPVPGTKEVKMMPFGAGRRSCPGSGLAMTHIASLVSALVREFEWAPPADGGGGIDLTEGRAVVLKLMASPLRACIKPRVSSQAP